MADEAGGGVPDGWCLVRRVALSQGWRRVGRKAVECPDHGARPRAARVAGYGPQPAAG